jgi:hypothetical protein
MPPYLLQLQPSRRQELSAKIEQLHRCMKAELEELRKRINLPLPPELMGMIFDFYVHLYNQLPEKLLLVCRAWHVLALSQPTLWTNLNLLDQFDLTIVEPWAGTFLQCRIARSNPAPLKVDFTRPAWDMPLGVVEKVASIPTLLPRIQELVIGRKEDLHYLVGDQPLLQSLSVRDHPHALEQVIENPTVFKLAGKKLTTLCLRCPPKLLAWPNSLLQRLQTLELTLTDFQECWTIIEKSTTLRTLHLRITPSNVNPLVLYHPSVECLSIVYHYLRIDQIFSLEGVRLPCLRDLTIDTLDSLLLMKLKLVEAPVVSLRLICRPRWSHSWVDEIVCFLRSIPHLKKMEISAPSFIVSGVLEAFEKDSRLGSELTAFIVGPTETGTETGTVEGPDQRDLEARFDQLRGNASQCISF